jgi:hypothetical protein
MWARGCFLVIVVLGISRYPAWADDVVPTGVGWYCFTASDEFNPKDRAGACYRNEESCQALRGDFVTTATMSPVVTECRYQKNAAALTYYNVMREITVFAAMPSSALCGEHRRYLARDRDNRSISACRLVGDRRPPPGKFQRDRVPGGSNWYCTNNDEGAINVCARKKDECAKAVQGNGSSRFEACTFQSNAYAVTWASTSDGDDLFTAAVSLPAYGIGVFRSSSECQRYAKHASALVAGLSPCTLLSGRQATPAADRSAFPEGTGWFCYSIDSIDSKWNEDLCFRDQHSCDELRSGVDKRGLEPTKCTRAPKAYAYTVTGSFYAFPSKQLCEQAASVSDDPVSRCESVGDVANRP